MIPDKLFFGISYQIHKDPVRPNIVQKNGVFGYLKNVQSSDFDF